MSNHFHGEGEAILADGRILKFVINNRSLLDAERYLDMGLHEQIRRVNGSDETGVQVFILSAWFQAGCKAAGRPITTEEAEGLIFDDGVQQAILVAAQKAFGAGDADSSSGEAGEDAAENPRNGTGTTS